VLSFGAGRFCLPAPIRLAGGCAAVSSLRSVWLGRQARELCLAGNGSPWRRMEVVDAGDPIERIHDPSGRGGRARDGGGR
jgi:hypothetical protein